MTTSVARRPYLFDALREWGAPPMCRTVVPPAKRHHCLVCDEPNAFNRFRGEKSEHFTTVACKHGFCNECLHAYLRVSIDSGASYINCPCAGCPFTLLDCDVEKFSTPELFQRYLERKSADHKGRLQELLGGGLGDDSVASWLRENTKPCPSCFVLIHRYEGCSSMRCTCGCQFCWTCAHLRCKCGVRCPIAACVCKAHGHEWRMCPRIHAESLTALLYPAEKSPAPPAEGVVLTAVVLTHPEQSAEQHYMLVDVGATQFIPVPLRAAVTLDGRIAPGGAPEVPERGARVRVVLHRPYTPAAADSATGGTLEASLLVDLPEFVGGEEALEEQSLTQLLRPAAPEPGEVVDGVVLGCGRRVRVGLTREQPLGRFQVPHSFVSVQKT